MVVFIYFLLSSLLVSTCGAFSVTNGNLCSRRRDCSPTWDSLYGGRYHFGNVVTPFRSFSLSAVRKDDIAEQRDPSSDETRLVFPGGGIFFYWQAGAVTYLREQGYDLSKTNLSGASAGALTATLTATGVDFDRATSLALDLAEDAGVWDRSGGLQGIWGPMIEDWLDELLPENAVNMVENGRLSLLVTPVPSFGRSKISDFLDRKDLINCNMASVHLPWFLDGKLTSKFRGGAHIDGSFLATETDYHADNLDSVICLDWTKDPIMAQKANDFVKVISKEGIWNMKETGMRFAEKMEANGQFEMLRRYNDEKYADKRERVGLLQRMLRR